MSDPLILIPARLAATRLPSKPLADIAGAPMIVHVWRRAVEAGIGPVVVATDTDAIAEAIEAQGGLAVMTRADHPSGSDRLVEALEIVDPDGNHDVVVNVQGDLPTIDPAIIAASVTPLADPQVDIATLCAVIHRAEEMDDPNVVKIIGHTVGPNRLRALAFTRARAPWGRGRCSTISASTPIAGRRWRGSTPCRRASWSGVRSWNSCARWRPACASMR
ncbi:hypothetical protein GCM10025880_30690 [Methylorubrum aminovorans]|nr:hypothetical protein GCM10025880_30690 [Methylorubrum aminovorans]